ncbi:MAG: ornithine-acyl[acyl carrier protein] N-acyltransferase [Tardiphaga sp.]|nr:ornithine-acyl[acyl carrier protein] N-acyltransferase [Tardiphaga sp.]
MDEVRRIGATQRLIELLPGHAGLAARATGDWFRGVAPHLVRERPITSLGRIGPLEVRLAQHKSDIKRAQKLRYNVFYKHGHAIADAATLLARRDKDAFDKICDHLMVIDHDAPPTMRGHQPVVGTYRLLRQEMADAHHGFYSENEFDLAPMLARHHGLRFLELGRSCVLPAYRTKRTVELLWRGIWNYVRMNRIDVMIGCASLDGTDADRLALPLSYLHHYARAPEPWHAPAQPWRRVEMNRLAKQAIDPRAALRALPPLVKGYLRVGAFIGDGAVIDHQFGTTDVLIVLPVSAIAARYSAHFEGRA